MLIQPAMPGAGAAGPSELGGEGFRLQEHMESSCVYLIIYLIIPVLLASLANVSCPCTTLAMNKKIWGDRNYHNSRPYSFLEKRYLEFCVLEGKVSVSLVLALLYFFSNKECEAWFWILPVKGLVFMVNSNKGKNISAWWIGRREEQGIEFNLTEL